MWNFQFLVFLGETHIYHVAVKHWNTLRGIIHYQLYVDNTLYLRLFPWSFSKRCPFIETRAIYKNVTFIATLYRTVYVCIRLHISLFIYIYRCTLSYSHVVYYYIYIYISVYIQEYIYIIHVIYHKRSDCMEIYIFRQVSLNVRWDFRETSFKCSFSNSRNIRLISALEVFKTV